MPFQTSRVSSRLDLLYLVAREFNAGFANIDQALYNILSATVAAVSASDASLFLFNSEGDLENSFFISDFEIHQRQFSNLEAISEHGLLGWVRRHREGALVKDTTTDERWYSVDDTPKHLRAGSAICVPIQLSNQFIGVITITSTQINHFDDSDLEMLATVADQAAFAVTNARLFKAEQHRRRLADTLASITHTINSTLDLQEVLDLILEQLSLVIDFDSSSIFLYDDDGETLVVRAAHGFEDMEDALSVSLPFDENIPNYQATILKKTVVIPDVDAEPYWIKSPSSQKVRSWIGVPLIARDEVVGMLTVDSYEVDKYTEENVSVVSTFANQAATAVANAQAVTRLQNAEASYSALFEDNTDMVIITNYQGLILDINRKGCQVLRRPKDAFINLDIAFINSRLPGLLKKQTKRLKLWREASMELDIKDAYRQAVPLEFKVRQVQFRGKDCVQWVGRDISKRKELEKMRQDMVNMLMHDLRGPLGNLINAIELISMLIDRDEDLTKVKHFLEMASRSGQAVNDLIDSMLDVSRLEQGEIPLQRRMTDINNLLQAVEEQVTPQAKLKQMELTIHPLPEALEVWLDNSLIRRVLINLIGNAIKYTPDKGCISLTANATKDKLCFAISDTGPGISKSDQGRVFDKFSRVGDSTTASGVGLGLAFCKLATEAHSGTISVESEGIPGHGSIFRVTLPIFKK